MVAFITITTIMHAVFFYFDEYIIHKKRSMNQKEINTALIGGVLFLATVAMTIFTSFTLKLSAVYIALAVFSCLFIIANEAFYPEVITRREKIIHAILYILHPVILYAFYQSWKMNFFHTNMNYWMLQLGYLAIGFKAIAYHVIYWNYIHDDRFLS